MEYLSKSQIDESINHIVSRLSTNSGIQDLFPNQRRLLHEFCKGQNIIYTGTIHQQIQSVKLYLISREYKLWQNIAPMPLSLPGEGP